VLRADGVLVPRLAAGAQRGYRRCYRYRNRDRTEWEAIPIRIPIPIPISMQLARPTPRAKLDSSANIRRRQAI